MGLDSGVITGLTEKVAELLPHLNERQRRLYLGSEARALGGTRAAAVAVVAAAAGVSRATVAAGADELASGAVPQQARVRRPGGGRRRVEDADPGLAVALRDLMVDGGLGRQGSPLLWTTLSLRELAWRLTKAGHGCGPDTVARLLREDGFSLRGASRAVGRSQYPDRNAEFRSIAGQAQEFLAAGEPVISVTASKREQPSASSENGHAWVNAAVDQHTADLVAESVRRWWLTGGSVDYPRARRLLIVVDAGGSGVGRLVPLTEETGLGVTWRHLPPGTSKWNVADPRLTAQVTLNRPSGFCVTYAVAVSVIVASVGRKGIARFVN